jgi:thiamine pyrophosphate-dependent acetolactate synthase large subunit-like protein
MRAKGDDNVWVELFVLAELSGLWSCTTSLTRDELTERVLDHSFSRLGLRWKRTTAARRVREALESLLQGDEPVISAGHGYKLASRATPAERERAAQLAERQAARLFAKARKIRAVVLPGDPRDGDLFLEARR